jgi:hypothetical protein
MWNANRNLDRFLVAAFTVEELRPLRLDHRFETLAWHAQDTSEMQRVVEFGLALLADGGVGPSTKQGYDAAQDTRLG